MEAEEAVVLRKLVMLVAQHQTGVQDILRILRALLNTMEEEVVEEEQVLPPGELVESVGVGMGLYPVLPLLLEQRILGEEGEALLEILGLVATEDPV
jgi:hypothetical protein